MTPATGFSVRPDLPAALASRPGLTQSFAPVAENVTFDQVQHCRTGNPTQRLPTATIRCSTASLAATDANAPLVILIHGGCWLNSFDVNHSRPLATALNQEGFAVWSLEYRRTGDSGGGWPGTLEDIQLALSQLERLSSTPLICHGSPLRGTPQAVTWR